MVIVFGIVKQIPWNCIIGKSILRKLHGHLFLDILSPQVYSLYNFIRTALRTNYHSTMSPQSLQQHQCNLYFQCNNCQTYYGAYLVWFLCPSRQCFDVPTQYPWQKRLKKQLFRHFFSVWFVPKSWQLIWVICLLANILIWIPPDHHDHGLLLKSYNCV